MFKFNLLDWKYKKCKPKNYSGVSVFVPSPSPFRPRPVPVPSPSRHRLVPRRSKSSNVL